MRPALLAIPLLLVLGVLGFFLLFAPSPTPEAKPADPKAIPDLSQSYWPLAKGAKWTYRVDQGEAGFRTRIYYCKSVKPPGVFKVFENSDGNQTDTLEVRVDGQGNMRYDEYSVGENRAEIHYLPGPLEAGTTWKVGKRIRAEAEDTFEKEVPTPEGPKLRTCVRVRWERFYPESLSKNPGWYPDSTLLFAQGVGLLELDSTTAQAPPDFDEVPFRRYRMRLEDYRPGS